MYSTCEENLVYELLIVNEKSTLKKKGLKNQLSKYIHLYLSDSVSNCKITYIIK